MASVARGFVYLTYCPLLKFTTNVTNSLGMADLDFQIFFFFFWLCKMKKKKQNSDLHQLTFLQE